jgi:hypothetical protein
MKDAFRAEWTKLRTMASTFWTPATTGSLTTVGMFTCFSALVSGRQRARHATLLLRALLALTNAEIAR